MLDKIVRERAITERHFQGLNSPAMHELYGYRRFIAEHPELLESPLLSKDSGSAYIWHLFASPGHDLLHATLTVINHPLRDTVALVVSVASAPTKPLSIPLPKAA